MNELQYNNQSLNEYLLGSLSDAETERFDERSFTDEEFADALKVAENDLVDAYIHNELTGVMLEKFKIHYLASPRSREKVEFAKAFQVYAKTNIEETPAKVPTVIETKPKRIFAGFFSNILTIPRPAWQWGFAFTALALLFFGGWLWRENSRQQSEMSQANANREQLRQRESEIAEREKQLQGEITNRRSENSDTERKLARVREERAQLEQQIKQQTREQQLLAEQKKLAEQERIAQTPPPISPNRVSVASFILTPSLRGGGDLQTVSIPAQTTAIAMRLELEADDYAVYRAVLRDQADNRILWQSSKLKSKSGGENKRLDIGFPANLLKNQIYSIEVSGVSTDGTAETISNYSFRVVR